MDKQILVTGAKGFIGRNLIAELRNRGIKSIFEYDIDTSESELDFFVKNSDFIYHLAGVNRPIDPADYLNGNYGFTSTLLSKLEKSGNKCPIMISSSTQAEFDNLYGKSKKAGEELILEYGIANDVDTFVYRFPNVFGKWSKPNYNSVVATFCHNIARDLPIEIHDSKKVLELVYIDDLLVELLNALDGRPNRENKLCRVNNVHHISLGEIAGLIRSFKKSRDNLYIPEISTSFGKALYSTYLSFLPSDQLKYPLKMNIDNRGSFSEFLKIGKFGQISVNVSKPGITKGNHWHHTKNEKFLVVRGSGVIKVRNINQEDIIEVFVSEKKFEVVDIPVGYTHCIENLGTEDMITIIWANEVFDQTKPDTYFCEV